MYSNNMTSSNASDEGIARWAPGGSEDKAKAAAEGRREPSGAAVAGAHPRPTNYPRQVVLMLTDAQADRIAEEASLGKMSKSEVGRAYLEAGFAAVDAEVATERARNRS